MPKPMVIERAAITATVIEGVSGEALATAIREHGVRDVRYVARRKDVAQTLADIVEPGDLVLTLGAGDITTSSDELVALLKADGKNS